MIAFDNGPAVKLAIPCSAPVTATGGGAPPKQPPAILKTAFGGGTNSSNGKQTQPVRATQPVQALRVPFPNSSPDKVASKVAALKRLSKRYARRRMRAELAAFRAEIAARQAELARRAREACELESDARAVRMIPIYWRAIVSDGRVQVERSREEFAPME